MGVIYRYKKMKELSAKDRKAKFVPRVCMFGGKAFATYWQAKRIVKLITDVSATINNDSEIGDLLKVIFIPDYNVSVAEVLIPASELSQHIRWPLQPYTNPSLDIIWRDMMSFLAINLKGYWPFWWSI